MAVAVGHRRLVAETWVWFHISGQRGTGTGFSDYFGFSLYDSTSAPHIHLQKDKLAKPGYPPKAL